MMKKLLTLVLFVLLSSPALADSDAVTCLAVNLYHEARSEEAVGAIAAGYVVVNRVNSKRYPNDVCSVIKQGGERRHKCQFSWWCDGKSDRISKNEIEQRAYQRMRWYAKLILGGNIGDPSGGALFYHTAGVNPYWMSSKEQTVRLGYHIFYR